MFFNITQKQCSKCKNVKSIDKFGKRNDRKNGRHSWCNDCMSSKSRNRYTSDPERFREEAREYRKKFPEKTSIAVRRWEAKHPEKVKEHDRKAYQKFVDKIKERVRQWNIANPEKRNEHNRNRRALKRVDGEKITNEQWNSILDKYGNKCLCCEATNVKLTMDHVMPLKHGGRHIIENVQPLCFSCNSSKGTKTIDYR